MAGRRVQHLKAHTIQLPGLARLATRPRRWPGQNSLGLGRVRQRRHQRGRIKRGPHRCCRLVAQQRQRTAHVVAIAVGQHHVAGPLAQGMQQGLEHALTGIALRPPLRAGINQHAGAGGADQHRTALPHIGSQHLKLTLRGPRWLPQQSGQHARQAQPAQARRRGQGQQQATGHGSQCQHGRRMGQHQTGPGPGRQPCQPLQARLQQPGRQLPQRGPHCPRQRQWRDQQRGHGYGHQIGQQPHQRHLAKPHQRQRSQRQRDAPLGAQQADQLAPATRVGIRVQRHQHPDGHKAQPETGLQPGPGLPNQHHRHDHHPHHGPGPAPPQQTQTPHHRQHQHRALRRNAPPRKHRIRQCQHPATPERRHRGRAGQQQAAAPAGRQRRCPAPGPPHQPGTQPGPQGDVQTRNADQMGHARGSEHIPVSRINRSLVTHHKCRQQTGGTVIGHPLPNLAAQMFAQWLQPVPGGSQAHRGWIGGRHAHRAGGTQPLAPHPQFSVKTVGVGQTVRLAQTHRQSPTLSGLWHGPTVLGPPAERHPPRQARSRCRNGRLPPRSRWGACTGSRILGRQWPLHLLHLNGKPPAQRGSARQIVHLACQQQGLALPLCSQHLRLVVRSPPPCAARSQQHHSQTNHHQRGTPSPAWATSSWRPPLNHRRRQRDQGNRKPAKKHVNAHRPQHRLLQLHHHPSHPGQRHPHPGAMAHRPRGHACGLCSGNSCNRPTAQGGS